MFYFRIVLLVLICFSSSSIWASELTMKNEITTVFGERFTLYSPSLKEKRELLISLPETYGKKKQNYAVLFTLDGERHFQHAVLATRLLNESGKLPPIIIVGISNNTGQRMRDSYDGRDTFLNFIVSDVITYIDDKYSTSGKNLLFGHSAMGLVTLHALVKHQSYFDQFIVSSPAIDGTETELFKSLHSALKSDTAVNKSLYMSVGDETREGTGFYFGANKLYTLLNKSNDGPNLTFEHLKGQNHTSAPYVAIFNGLASVFYDFEEPAINSVKTLKHYGGIDKLIMFFEQRGKKYGVTQEIPQTTITRLAFAFYGEGKLDEAITLLNNNINKYLNPTRILGALGFVLEQKGIMNEALLAYEKALALVIQHEAGSQSQQYYQSKVKELQSKTK